MKSVIGGMMIAGVMMSGLAGCGGKEQKRAADVQPEDEMSRKLVTEVVYSATVAAGKPAFADDESRLGPLKLSDGRKRFRAWTDTVAIADFGAYMWEGQHRVDVSFTNFSQDTLLVDSVLLPDARFEANWQAPERFIPNMLSGIVLRADSIEAINDYKVVVVFQNKNIPAQTLHVNIHPDINKLHADYAASQAE